MPEVIFEFPDKPLEEGRDKYDAGCKCPECGSFLKRYRRKLNSNMAFTLLALYKAGVRDFVHVEKWLLKNNHSRSGDFHKLVHFNLLDRLDGKRDDNSTRNGFYRLNGRSIMFCELKLKVKNTAVIFNGKLEKFEGDEVDIISCLGQKFSYQELMNG
jgi:hypothetical protein